jgi:hypothetical protein
MQLFRAALPLDITFMRAIAAAGDFEDNEPDNGTPQNSFFDKYNSCYGIPRQAHKKLNIGILMEGFRIFPVMRRCARGHWMA